ncbi:MAG: response regulator [Oligoflexus sp.]|nr:response regulator [Oligoflexus sp.]
MTGTLRNTLLTGDESTDSKFEFGEKSKVERAPTRAVRQNLGSPVVLRKILLVDDDPTFGKIMKRAAEVRGIALTFCSAIDEVAQHTHEKFDIALIDFNLGAVTGVEFSEYLSRYDFGDLNTIIISQRQQTISNEWPANARKFVHKNVGPQMILDVVCQAFEKEQTGDEK